MLDLGSKEPKRTFDEVNRKAILVFSHELTDDQEDDLQSSWNITEVFVMPPQLRELWMNVPPHLQTLKNYVDPVVGWIEQKGSSGDIVLVQGDMGATFLVVCRSIELGLLPVYATTRRVLHEEVQSDGSVVLKRVFKHERFRAYGR